MVGVTKKGRFMGLTSLVNISQNLDKSGSLGVGDVVGFHKHLDMALWIMGEDVLTFLRVLFHSKTGVLEWIYG